MRKTLRIKTRLLLTVGFVAAMLAASSGVALWRLNAISQGVDQVMRGDARVAGEMAQFVLSVGDLVQHERAYLVNASRSQSTSGELQAWKTAYTSATQRLSEIETFPDARASVTSLRGALRSYENEFATIRGRIEAEGSSKVDAAGADGTRMRDAFARLERQTGDQMVRYRGQADARRTEVQGDIIRGYAGIGVALVAGLLFVVAALRYFVYSPVAAEADAIARVCDSVAVGDLSSRVPNPSETELGSVARSLNSMLDNTVNLVQTRTERDQMQAAVMKLLEEVGGVAEGDLTVQAEVTADVTGAVADSFNFMIGQLRQIIGQVQAASRQVSTALAELREVTGKLATGSEDQAAQAVEASVAIEEMAASIHYVSENASSSASVAEQARTNAEHGTRAVTRTIEGMKAVRDQVQETAKRIKRLGESSQEIGEIVELIGDIGDRTSILALNASIQAAMAGEAGRGFAIVADEVERLADRATEATKRAGILVKATSWPPWKIRRAKSSTARTSRTKRASRSPKSRPCRTGWPSSFRRFRTRRSSRRAAPSRWPSR